MSTSTGDASRVDDALPADLDIVLAEGRPAIALAHGVSGLPAACDWLAERHDAIRSALHRFGSLLIRGLPVTDADDFAAVRDQLLGRHPPYPEESSPRSEVGDGVYSSTDMPARHPIRLHNESSYVLNFPSLLLFGCVIPPTGQGATTVGDSRAVLARLDPALVERFRSRGWTLLRNYHPGLSLSWSVAFGMTDRDEVERYLQEALIAWRWRADGSLLTSQRRPAVLRHPDTGEETWFNHVAFWSRYTLSPELREVLLGNYGEGGLPYDTAYGDGEPLSEAEVGHLNEVYDQVRQRESYRTGDLLLVDNMLACHGREPYQGDRKVLVAMGAPRAVSDCAPEVAPAPGPLPG